MFRPSIKFAVCINMSRPTIKFAVCSFMFRPTIKFTVCSFMFRPTVCKFAVCNFMFRPKVCKFAVCNFMFRPTVCKEVAESGFMAWLIKKLKVSIAIMHILISLLFLFYYYLVHNTIAFSYILIISYEVFIILLCYQLIVSFAR